MHSVDSTHYHSKPPHACGLDNDHTHSSSYYTHIVRFTSIATLVHSYRRAIVIVFVSEEPSILAAPLAMRLLLSLALLLVLHQLTVLATPHTHVAYNTIRPARNTPLPGRGDFTPSPFTSTTPLTSTSHYHPQSSHQSPSSSSTLRHPAGQRIRPSTTTGPPSLPYCDAHLSPLYSALLGNYSTELVGGDLPGQPVSLPAASTSVDCSLLCLVTEGCVGWSYAAVFDVV